VQPPKAARPELVMLPAADVMRLLAHTDETPIGPRTRMAVMTGMRRGELLGLRWRDVEMTASRPRARHSLTYCQARRR
jgi:integrase